MKAFPSTAQSLSQEKRKNLGILSLSKTETITDLAAREGVSRKYIYEQKRKAQEALDERFADKADDDEVLFMLPVTQAWLNQLIIALVLICHSSYGGVKELLRDLFDICVARARSTTGCRRSPSKPPGSIGPRIFRRFAMVFWTRYSKVPCRR